MSQRDRELLCAAGLSRGETATMLNRSRQAIYTGLSRADDYFKMESLARMVTHLRAIDSPHIDRAFRFIEGNYSERICNLILPERISLGQLRSVASESERIIFFINLNEDHLRPSSLLTRALQDMQMHKPESLHVMSPAQWVLGYLTHALGTQLLKPSVLIPSLASLPFAFVSFAKTNCLVRTFIFCRYSAAEMDSQQAIRLNDKVVAFAHAQQPSPLR